MTPYDDVNAVLTHLSAGLTELLGEQLIGLYLTGSLTYGDYDPGSSDIDFLAVLCKELSVEQLEVVRTLHAGIGAAVLRWAKLLEGSNITSAMIVARDRPTMPRPYINGGEIGFYRYGDEWTIYLLFDSGLHPDLLAV